MIQQQWTQQQQWTVEVNRSDLLARIQENRAKHRSLFEEAIEGYRASAIKDVERLLDDLKAGKTPQLIVKLPLPVDHTEDYDRVIDMLEMDQRDMLTIPESMFREYVRDDWAWKREFLAAASNYSVSAAQEFTNY